MASNRDSVSFACYVSCVESQVSFLENEGFIRIMDGDRALDEMVECYDNNVSVDGCAAILTM